MDKKDGIHTDTLEYCHKKKKNETLPFATTCMEGIMLSEISQAEKAKYHMISLICGT